MSRHRPTCVWENACVSPARCTPRVGIWYRTPSAHLGSEALLHGCLCGDPNWKWPKRCEWQNRNMRGRTIAGLSKQRSYLHRPARGSGDYIRALLMDRRQDFVPLQHRIPCVGYLDLRGLIAVTLTSAGSRSLRPIRCLRFRVAIVHKEQMVCAVRPSREFSTSALRVRLLNAR